MANLTEQGRRNLIDAKLDEHAAPGCPCWYCVDKFGSKPTHEHDFRRSNRCAICGENYLPES